MQYYTSGGWSTFDLHLYLPDHPSPYHDNSPITSPNFERPRHRYHDNFLYQSHN